MLIRLMFFVVILACAALFFIKGDDGKPLMTIEKLFEGLPGSPSDLLSWKAETPATPVVTRIYKWKDENGVWQFSDSPLDEEGAEIMELDGQINIVPAFKPPGGVDEEKTPAAIPGVMTVSPREAGNMLDTVNNLQETMDQRKADMDEISNN